MTVPPSAFAPSGALGCAQSSFIAALPAPSLRSRRARPIHAAGSQAPRRRRVLRPVIAPHATQQRAIDRNASTFNLAAAPPTTFTSLRGNSFALSHAATTVLVDPWLTDDLVFGHPLFFRATKTLPTSAAQFTSPDAVDAIVLTQALPDHLHPPTLATFPKHIPIIAPPSAESLLRSLRFENVTLLPIAQTASPLPENPLFKISALKGPMVGPPWSTPENAYVFTFQQSPDHAPFQLYHEPHGTFDQPSMQPYVANLDAVIAPVSSARLSLPLGSYTLVNGTPEAVKLCEYVRPRTCVLFNNAQGHFSGLLSKIIHTDGGLNSFKAQIKNHPRLSDLNIVFPELAAKPYVLDAP
ncbi:unnamed protein product [Agarophyton chilense]